MSKVKTGIMALLFLTMLTAPVFAQSSKQGEQGNRPGPGYGAEPEQGYGPGYGYGMGPWMMGPGYGHGYGMGPWMMGPGWGGGYGMGPGMMGPGWGYGPGYGMMGRGYGYGPGPGQRYQNLTPEEREKRDRAFIEQYLERHLPGYTLEKKPQAKEK